MIFLLGEIIFTVLLKQFDCEMRLGDGKWGGRGGVGGVVLCADAEQKHQFHKSCFSAPTLKTVCSRMVQEVHVAACRAVVEDSSGTISSAGARVAASGIP